MKKSKKYPSPVSKALSILLAAVTAVFILTVSIAVPILFRPFYYMHIDLLKLDTSTGLSRTQIIRAYDEMMDFCTGQRDTFSTGILPWSQAGRDHFADVRGLFLLDLRAAVYSGLLLLSWTLLRKRSAVRPYRFMKHSFAFWGSAGLCGAFLCVSALAALDFPRAFVLFHTIFFPGKDNWRFDPHTDAIIRILPQAFFRNCAVLILLLIVAICLWLMIRDPGKESHN